jgi:RNA polymerase sigma-70 factor (ECF subfamily)
VNTISTISSDDTELLRLVAGGDPSALGELYNRHASLVFSVLTHRMGDSSEAQDIMHDVFAKLQAKAGHYRAGHGEPIAWLLTVAKNAAIDRLRRKATHRRYLESLQDESPVEQPNTLETNGLYDDEMEALKECIGALSGSQQQALNLAYFSGLTQQEVAEELNQPLGSVKAWIRRGLLKLKDCVVSKL